MVNYFFEAGIFTQVIIAIFSIVTASYYKLTINFSKVKFSLVAFFIWQLITIGIFFFLYNSYLWEVHLYFYIIPGLLISIPLILPKKEKVSDIFDVTLPTISNKDFVINLRRSVGIFGSSGAGKTESGYAWIIHHMAKNNLGGINYDYKDFELSELVYFYYKEFSTIPVFTFSPAVIELSNQINPILVDYINKTEDVLSISEVLITNLGVNFSAEAKIFSDAASGALAGVIWVLRCDYPEYCNLPIASSILLLGEMDEIYTFIERNTQARILASEIFESRESERLHGSIKVSLVNFMKRLATPSLYYLLSGNDVDLRLNDPDHLGILNLVNHPKYAEVYSPVIATILQSTILQMSERGRRESVFLLDEGSTIKIPNWQRVLATLRSYGIGSVWGLQDKVQGELLYKLAEVKAILANISTKLIGKANDPDTADYYERFFPFIKSKTHSVSRGTGFFKNSESRISESEREHREMRGDVFYKLKQGEFFILDDKGNINKRLMKRPIYERIEAPIQKKVTDFELQENFNNIHKIAKTLLLN